MSQAGASPGCTYAEGQVAIVHTSPGQQPLPAQCRSLDWGLQALGLLTGEVMMPSGAIPPISCWLQASSCKGWIPLSSCLP